MREWTRMVESRGRRSAGPFDGSRSRSDRRAFFAIGVGFRATGPGVADFRSRRTRAVQRPTTFGCPVGLQASVPDVTVDTLICMGEEGDGRTPRGSVVLVHGGGGDPNDWRQVRRLLEDAGVDVRTPDLPSHQSATAGLADDAVEVRDAIRSCAPPVVVVGWSYGGTVISMAADGEASVVRLIYVSAVPMPPTDQPGSTVDLGVIGVP
jgi:pimeloyl-ACP methyl ester carboxylesterase